jgi:hypothetical protein
VLRIVLCFLQNLKEQELIYWRKPQVSSQKVPYLYQFILSVKHLCDLRSSACEAACYYRNRLKKHLMYFNESNVFTDKRMVKVTPHLS